ncbi:MAG: hypothetical protein EOO90_05115 [Pedobacter sp.]|nr:MAG: hypothetical protein EOO90_05115 [Pedobacter sp.]
MNIKELLLNGQSFLALLREFSIDANDVSIQDEHVFLSDQNLAQREILKETICIEGKGKNGVFNFFGILHLNNFSKMAIFEMQGFEQVDLRPN